MNQTVLNEQKQVRGKTLIIVLAFVALALVSFSYISAFILDYSIFCPNKIVYLHILLDLVPLVLLAVFVLLLYKRVSARVIMPIIFGILSVPGFSLIEGWMEDYFSIVDTVLDLLEMLIFAGAAVVSAIGIRKKTPAIAVPCFGLAVELCYFYLGIELLGRYWGRKLYFVLFTNLAFSFGMITFYVVLLLFALNQEKFAAVPKTAQRPVMQPAPQQPVMYAQQPAPQQPVMYAQQPAPQQPVMYAQQPVPQQPVMYVQQPTPRQPANVAAGTLEQALLQLKQLYTSGLITEEEYAAKRNEIISRL